MGKSRRRKQQENEEKQFEHFVEELGANMANEILESQRISGEEQTQQDPSETTPDDIRRHHLIFVVHGMGQRKAKFIQNIQTLTELAEGVLSESSTEKFIFVPIEWHLKLHALPTVDTRMNRITLSTVPFFRQLNNDYLADSLYYFTKFHGEKILQIVVAEIHRKLAACRQRYFIL